MPLRTTTANRSRLRKAKMITVFFVAVQVLLSGCTVGPDYAMTSSNRISSHFTNGTANRMDGQFPSGANAEIPVDQWWHSFADPILNDLVSRAMHQSLDLQAAYERIVEARANFHLQTGQLLPNGTTQSEYQYVKRSPNARPFVGTNGDPFNLFTKGLSVSWELDLFGRIERTIQSAEASVELQEFDLESIRQVLVADIASSYLRVRLLQQQIALTQESLGLQRQTVEMIENRTSAGASTELDRAQTKSFLRRSEALLASLEQQLAVEFNQLSWLLGEPPGEDIVQIVGIQPLPQIPMLPAAGIPAELLRRRPDVRREERAIAAASARIGIAEADLYPRLSLIGDIRLAATAPSQLFQTDSLAFTVGPSFSWNLLHFGRINSNIEIFESQFRQAIVAYEQTVLQAVREVEDGLAQHHGAFRQWHSFAAAIEEDKTAVEFSLKRYEVGKVNFQRVIDAQQQLLLDRQQQASQQAAAIEQLIRTHLALGGGWNSAQQRTCGSCASSSCGCANGCSGGCLASTTVDGGYVSADPTTPTVRQVVPRAIASNRPARYPLAPAATETGNAIISESSLPRAVDFKQHTALAERYSNAFQLYPPVSKTTVGQSITR